MGRIFFLALTLVLTSTFLSSCRDESINNLELQPEADQLNMSYITNNQVFSYIQTEDSNRCDETGYNLLGSINDPIFGKVEASIMSQFYLSGTSPDFSSNGSGPKLDSLVLSLVYHNYYGDVGKSNGIQQLKVYELTKDLYVDSTYYSNLKTSDYYDATKPIATKTFWPQPNTAVKVGGSFLIPHLRIRLDTATFGRKIMGLNPGEATNLTSQELFLKFFKGLYITADNPFQKSNQGAILYFDLLSPLSKITAYYHNASDTSSFDYVISSSSSARLNLFKQNYAAAPKISQQLQDSTLGQQQIYVQAMAGLRSKLHFPLLKQLIDSNPIAIYKAEIILKIDEPFSGKYVPNSKLFLFGIDSVGNKKFLPDQTEANFANDYFGGTYNAANQQYRFNISRYAQLVATKKIQDNGLYLVTGTTYETANRVVVKGGNNIQLNVTYTKIKN